MKISAVVRNSHEHHEATVSTAGAPKNLTIHPKSGGGSAVNGGELLMLALATCYCNDLYREAARLGIPLEKVEVEAEAQFLGVGLAASDIKYKAQVQSPASAEAIARLLSETDAVAEIHNTVRAGVPVTRQEA